MAACQALPLVIALALTCKTKVLRTSLACLGPTLGPAHVLVLKRCFCDLFQLQVTYNIVLDQQHATLITTCSIAQSTRLAQYPGRRHPHSSNPLPPFSLSIILSQRHIISIKIPNSHKVSTAVPPFQRKVIAATTTTHPTIAKKPHSTLSSHTYLFDPSYHIKAKK